ncbi:MAG: endonuclease MutS2 [Gemmatimonadales bacterium]
MTAVEGEPGADGVPEGPAAGTPSSLAGPGSVEALDTIELPAVLDIVAGHAAGPLGAERVRQRRPIADLAWIDRELARVGEIAELFRRGDGLLAEPVPDVRHALARLRVEGSVLEGAELLSVGRVLGAGRAVHADLKRVAPQAPRSGELLCELPDRRLDRRIEQSIGPDGEVLDAASPRLAAARREVHDARQRLVRRLESLLRGLDAASVPQGATVTLREGRYVVPVRRDSRSRPQGIVHDESASAGTLFIEPAEAIELGNALREAQVAEQRETLRVLRELTDLLRPALPAIRATLELTVAVDDLVARARYAFALDAEVPAVDPAPAAVIIRNGRHPLLLAGGAPVVPFDLELTADERTLLVSGPNTGGKTVLLKGTALLSALAQSGIVPPVGAESRLPAFTRFFADIGDRQSIAASLSTFSAHVQALGMILAEADAASLVLLDEVGSGTDPTEGAALAAAVLATLTARGATTLATTHLGALKDLATYTPGVVNGSLEFDGATLAPSYRFQKGVPGRSWGLAIARRLGLPVDVLADAEARVPGAEKALDALLASVEERARTLEAEQAALAARQLDTEGLAARLALQHDAQESRERELRRREKQAERQGREQARAFLLDARERVEEAVARAKASTDDAAAREARRMVEEGIRALDEMSGGAEEQKSRGIESVGVGTRVCIAAGGTGEVVEVRADGRLVVLAGAMRMVVDAKSVALAGKSGAEEQKRRPAPLFGSSALPSDAGARFEVDLRGMTGDEAEAATVAAVDAAVLAEHPFLRIIHGMGTGVVRDRVHRVVRGDRRIARFALAPRNQGGSGVTIVEFGG